MTKIPYIRGVRVENFRGFKAFDLDGFKRVNILSGLNAGGKTSLMEAMFGVMDARNPTNFSRPAAWRNFPPTIESCANSAFHNSDSAKAISVEILTRDGSRRMETTFGEVDVTGMSFESNARTLGDTTTGHNGITQVVFVNGTQVIKRQLIDALPIGNFAIKEDGVDTDALPDGIFLSRKTIDLAGDVAGRFSSTTQARKKKRVVELARSLVPDVVDLEILQVGQQSILHAELPSGALIPLSFAGDGAATIVGLGLAIMNSKSGVIFVDEFEGSIHFSKLVDVWKELALLAEEHDCQIFAATHSRECISAALRGLTAVGRARDLNYVRLDRIGEEVRATKYALSDLETAFEENWEIR